MTTHVKGTQAGLLGDIAGYSRADVERMAVELAAARKENARLQVYSDHVDLLKMTEAENELREALRKLLKQKDSARALLEKKEKATKLHPEGAKFLQRSGLLFQINREILHKYGLSLTVIEYDDDRVEFEGLLATTDPEGTDYSPEDLEKGFQKLQAFESRPDTKERLRKREEGLGWLVQPRVDMGTKGKP
jgi:hypothetical protein